MHANIRTTFSHGDHRRHSTVAFDLHSISSASGIDGWRRIRHGICPDFLVFARVLSPDRFSLFIVVGAVGYSLWLCDLGLAKILLFVQNCANAHMDGQIDQRAAGRTYRCRPVLYPARRRRSFCLRGNHVHFCGPASRCSTQRILGCSFFSTSG